MQLINFNYNRADGESESGLVSGTAYSESVAGFVNANFKSFPNKLEDTLVAELIENSAHYS